MNIVAKCLPDTHQHELLKNMQTKMQCNRTRQKHVFRHRTATYMQTYLVIKQTAVLGVLEIANKRQTSDDKAKLQQ